MTWRDSRAAEEAAFFVALLIKSYKMNNLDMNISELKSARSLNRGNCGQGALEYLIFLAVLSAMLVFASPMVSQLRIAADDMFQGGVERILDPSP